MSESRAYEKPLIVSSEPDCQDQPSPEMILPVVIAVAAGTWIVVGVEAVTYSRKRAPKSEVSLGGPVVVTLMPPARSH